MVLQRNFLRKSAIQPKATSKSELKSVADLSASFCHLESGSGSYLNPNPYKKKQKTLNIRKNIILGFIIDDMPALKCNLYII